jgi:dihydrodiol dehydrogenase / D-xylose 1-dehydrogenase (NADP)
MQPISLLFTRSGVATLSFGTLAESAEETTVLGTKGRMTIGTPAHCPTRLTVTLKATGRGNTAREMVFDFPVPEDTEEIKASGGYFYPNSAGFAYEAAAVARCIATGKKEAPQYTLAETLVSATVIGEIRKQLGLKPIDSD